MDLAEMMENIKNSMNVNLNTQHKKSYSTISAEERRKRTKAKKRTKKQNKKG